MLSLMIRSFVWAAWWPASTWLLAMEKATARASDAFAETVTEPTAEAESREQPAAYSAQGFAGGVRPTSTQFNTARPEETSDKGETVQTAAETETRKDDMANDTFNKMEMPGSVRDLIPDGVGQ